MLKEIHSIGELSSRGRQIVGDSLFFSDEFKRLAEGENREFLILADEEYVIPVTVTRKICFVYASFLFHPLSINGKKNDECSSFLDECVKFLAGRKKVQFILPTPAYADFEAYPQKSKRICFGNYICDLKLGEEVLLANMHSKHRNAVRKAQKDGVIVKSGTTEELISEYVQMDNATWERSGKSSLGAGFYKKKIENLGDYCTIFIAYKDDEPQSGALIYYDSKRGYYMFGANKDRPYTGSGNLLQWEIMKFLMEQGVEEYSFVGCRINEDENSKYHDIQRFKSRFGGEMKTGFMFKCVCNFVMYGLFRMVMILKTRKIEKDVIDQEIPKWRELN